MAAKIFRINYKSDFILTMNSEAGWTIPFCIKFWTSIPMRAYYVGFDGTTYTHCAYDPSEPTKLLVQFDDHHLPIGNLHFQISYHFTVDDFPNNTEDEVFNEAALTTEIDGETYQVMLDFNGETAPGIDFSLPSVGVTSVNGKVGVVTLTAEDVGAQPTIADLATIRSGAAAGATAVQPATLQEGLAGKQDTISDLATIRSGAAAGSTAVQPAALQEGLAGKQDTISDLSTIRNGAAAGATAVQPAAMNTALAAKQDTLTFDNAPTANSNNPVKSSGIKTALDAKQSTISTVNVTVDNNTGTPSGSASVSGSTLSLSFQNLKGATGATGATGPQGPQGERGLPGESGVTGDVSGFTVIQTIDPSATYGATDIAGAAALQAANAELTELAGDIYANINLSNCKVFNDFVADIVLKENVNIDFSVYNRVLVSDLYYAASAYYLTLRLQGTDVSNLNLFSQSFSTKAAAESKFGILLESSYCYLVLRHVADGQRYEDITLTFNRDISWGSLNEHPVIKELLLEREILSNGEDIETLQNDVVEINDELIENESKSFVFTDTCCYTFTVGQAPVIESNSNYDCVSVDNLHEGDAVVLHARAGSSKVFCAKCLNGVVVSTIQSVSTNDNTIECDGTFDSLYVNNYSGYVASPTATGNLKIHKVDVLSEKVEELEEVKTNDAIPQYVSLAVVETNAASYIRRTDGAVMSASTSGFQVRKYAVEANKVYFLSGSTGSGDAACMAAFYTSNGTYIAGSVINPANIYPNTSWERFKVVSPANAAFVKVQRASADNNINAEVISDYASVYSIAQQLLSGNLTGNVLQGKKWAACGDSNTVGDFTGYSGNSVFPSDSKYAGEKMVYPRFIAERNDMNLVMDAVGGSTIALTKAYVDDPTHVDINTRYPFSYERYSEVPLDCDYITLWFGGNDTECYLGEITDETNESVYGAWNVVLRYFITNAPFAKIGIIVPYTSTSTIREAVRNVAKKWGIPYLDMAGDVKVPMMRIRETELGVSSEAETLRQEAYRVSATNSHMNPLAHKYQSTFIEHWLRSL